MYIVGEILAEVNQMGKKDKYFEEDDELFTKRKKRPDKDYRDDEYISGKGERIVVRVRPESDGADQGAKVYYQGPVEDERAGKFSFSQKELQHLGVASFCLTIAFGFGIMGGIRNFNFFELLINLFIAAVAVGTGFLLHEMAHKFVAQYYGYWAEFRYNLFGLGFALFLGIVTGFVFAAPGAVYIRGWGITKEENGKISAAGPATNFGLAVIFGGLFFLSAFLPFLQLFAFYGLWINLILGCFNLLPIGPLDGRKILAWNPIIYITMCIFLGGPLIALFLFSWGIL